MAISSPSFSTVSGILLQVLLIQSQDALACKHCNALLEAGI